MRKETKILAILLAMILMYMGVFSKIAWMNVHADQEKIVPSSVDGFEYHIKTYESGYKEYECTTKETQIYHSYEEAVKGIAELSRRLIKEQKVKLFILSIPVEIKCDSKIKQIEDFSVDKEISKEIFKETGNPEDGYTLFMFASGGGNFLAKDLNNNPEYKDGSYKGIWHASACGYGDKTERYNQTVEKLDQVLKELDLDGKSDYEKCKEIMWWIAKNVKYDTHYNGSPEIPAKTKHPHDMTGAVLDGYCVCDGYAGVFYYMANAAGLPALYDDGKFYSGGHAWNLVQIDGKYYYIDLTGAVGNFDKDGNVNTEFLLGSDTYTMQKYTSDNDDIKNTYGDLISKDDYSKEHSVCKGNHDLFYEGKNGAQCDKFGCYLYRCKNKGCFYVYEEKIPALGHEWDEGTITQKQSCESPEITTYKCIRTDIWPTCKATKQLETKPSLGSHIWDNGKITKQATCTTAGEKTYTCTRCQQTKTEAIAKIPHEYEENVIKAPTCTSYGVSTYTCKNCGYTTSERSTKATGHQHTEIRNQRAATCERSGYTGDTYCNDCKKMIKMGTTILPIGHTWGDWEIFREPDCKYYGWKTHTCKTCNTTEGEIIEKLDTHQWDQGKITKKATCTEDGERTYTCMICKKTMIETIPSTGHQYGPWKVIKNQSVFTAKQQRHTCKTCGHQETKTIGKKLKPTLKTNAASLKLKRKQTTTRFVITGLAKGDYVRSLSSNNKKIVTITGNKKGTCKIKAGSKTGKAKITISLASGLKKTISVNVQKKSVLASKIKNVPRKLTLKKNQSYQLKPVIEPITCTEKVKYKSSNKKIIKVTSKGKIKAMKKGKGKITIIVGNKKIICKAIIK